MASSSATKAIIIAHRGASAYRPEHTLAAYQLAMDMGADFIEPDLVATRDGHLIARHENELSSSTNVADIKDFSDYKTTKFVDGVKTQGWFSEDFTLAQIKQLRARERVPDIRPDNTDYNDEFCIPTLSEIIQLVHAESERSGKQIGIYPETKHPTYFQYEGKHLDGTPIATSLNELLIQELIDNQLNDSDRVFIQSFEVQNLIELKQQLMPQAGLNIPLVQLIGNNEAGVNTENTNFYQPYDWVYNQQQKHDLNSIYSQLSSILQLDPESNYQALTQDQALRWVKQYATSIGPWKNNLYRFEQKKPVAKRWFKSALALGLGVHPYTFRAEAAFTNSNDNGPTLSYEEELGFLLSQGITGFFTDHTDLGLTVREKYRAS